MAAGCEYSEAVLAFKLLREAGLEEAETCSVLGSLAEDWRNKSGGILRQLKLYLGNQDTLIVNKNGYGTVGTYLPVHRTGTFLPGTYLFDV